MDSHFMFGATAHPFLLDAAAELDGGSRLLSVAQAKALAEADAAKANEPSTVPVYYRVIDIPRGRFGWWVWQVDTEVRGERVTVVGPRKAWTQRAAVRRAFRHYERLTREAAER